MFWFLRQEKPISELDLEGNFKRVRFFGINMALGLLLYLAIAEFMLSAGMGENRVSTKILRYLFYSLAIAQTPFISIVRTRLLRRNPGDELKNLIKRLVAVSFITFAFVEAVALYGLVLFFISFTRFDLYILVAYALVLLAIYFPRYDVWEEYISAGGFSPADLALKSKMAPKA